MSVRYTVDVDDEGHVSYFSDDGKTGKWFDTLSPHGELVRTLLAKTWDEIGSEGWARDDVALDGADEHEARQLEEQDD